MKDDLYRILSMRPNEDGHYYQLKNLRKRGYIEYGRRKGPVWLTIQGLDAIKGVIHEEI